jgi:hypothetical protein
LGSQGRRRSALLVDPDETARAINFIVSDDTGLMTGAVANFDQAVWGAAGGVMPVSESPTTLSTLIENRRPRASAYR